MHLNKEWYKQMLPVRLKCLDSSLAYGIKSINGKSSNVKLQWAEYRFLYIFHIAVFLLLLLKTVTKDILIKIY